MLFPRSGERKRALLARLTGLFGPTPPPPDKPHTWERGGTQLPPILPAAHLQLAAVMWPLTPSHDAHPLVHGDPAPFCNANC